MLAALMTPRGRGAVAVIRVVGDLSAGQAPSSFRAVNGQPLLAQPLGKIVFGQWGNDAIEDVVVCRLDARTLEVHCHGGTRAAERILEDWQAAGADVVPWSHLIAATADDLDAELQNCLSQALTWRTAEYFLRQSAGVFRSACEQLLRMEWTTSGRLHAADIVAELLRWSEFGVHLTEPWRVVLTGPPNVGKSSLINALLGHQRSIVFDEPGTTRDVVRAITAFEGWPVQLSDTAGLRSGAGALEAEGIARARQELAEADLVVLLFDISVPPEEIPGIAEPATLLVAHKCDLPDRWGPLVPLSATRVSSVTQHGVDALQREIVRRLVPELPALEMPLLLTRRHIARFRGLEAALKQGDFEQYQQQLLAVFAARENTSC